MLVIKSYCLFLALLVVSVLVFVNCDSRAIALQRRKNPSCRLKKYKTCLKNCSSCRIECKLVTHLDCQYNYKKFNTTHKGNLLLILSNKKQ